MIAAATTQTDPPSAPGSPADGATPTGVAPDTGASTAPAGGLPDAVRQRLSTLDNWLNPYSWLVTVVVVAIAAILRLVGLSKPKGYIFDEVYYPTDAWDMLQRGVEWDDKTNGPAYVVHPPLGKWLIGLGELTFGNNELGWRFPAAIAGTAMVLILIRVAYRMFHSIVLAGAAGLLMALDGFHLVLSRTSLLDIFLGLFLLACFAALVLDRDAYRRRWRRALQAGWDPTTTPRLAFAVPWWLLVAGVLLGLAAGVKWSAAFFVPFYAALVLAWRVGARRSAGVRRPVRAGLLGDLGWLLLAGVLAGLVYLATWTGWFITDVGYFRHWRADNAQPEPPVLGPLLNLAHYHLEAFSFHNGLDDRHVYQSWPWQWLLLGRPVAFYWSSSGPCDAANCAAEVLLLGTPILWWSFLPALLALVWLGIARRDWRAYAIGTGVTAGLLPWFYFALSEGRTMFSFYALPAVPFLVLAVVYVLGALMTPAPGAVADLPAGSPQRDSPHRHSPHRHSPHRHSPHWDRQLVATIVAAGYVVLVAISFAYFHPIFIGQHIPYGDWSARMWLGGRWI